MDSAGGGSYQCSKLCTCGINAFEIQTTAHQTIVYVFLCARLIVASSLRLIQPSFFHFALLFLSVTMCSIILLHNYICEH